MQDQTLAEVGRHVPPGSNALLAEVDEYTDGVVDGAMTAPGGTMLRRSADDVLAEIEAAEEAAARHRGRPARRRENARRLAVLTIICESLKHNRSTQDTLPSLIARMVLAGSAQPMSFAK